MSIPLSRWLLPLIIVLVACGGGDDEAAPTATPTTPPATPTPTVVPPTPTPEGTPAVEVGNWTAVEASHGGTTYVMGEVTNTGTAHAAGVNVVVSAYDAAGTVIASQGAWDIMPIIPPGAMSPFKVTLLDVARDAVAEFRLAVEFTPLRDALFGYGYYSLGLMLPQITWTDDRIAGEVRNTTMRPLEGVQVLAIGYDADGDIIGVERMLPDLDRLPPRTIGTFSTTFMQWPAAATVEAVAWGRFAG